MGFFWVVERLAKFQAVPPTAAAKLASYSRSTLMDFNWQKKCNKFYYFSWKRSFVCCILYPPFHHRPENHLLLHEIYQLFLNFVWKLFKKNFLLLSFLLLIIPILWYLFSFERYLYIINSKIWKHLYTKEEYSFFFKFNKQI